MIRKSAVVLALGVAGALFNTSAGAATTATANMDVTLTVESSCTLAVDPLDFGTHSIGDTDISASTDATVTCTQGTPYILTSDNTHDYIMTNASGTTGTNTVAYTLYLDSAGTEALAQDIPDDAAVTASASTGTGAAETVPIYGKLNETTLANVGPGTYNDTVTLQLTY